MARKIDAIAQQAKLNEILDCAQRLLYTNGYEQMSIQDIISQLGISKGAFYHYFDSKPALLEALLNRTTNQAVDLTFPILRDPSTPALKKLEKFYAATNKWKATQKEYLLGLLSTWYSDENALVRQKLITYLEYLICNELDKVFRQGMEEGEFNLAYPDMAGQVVFSLMTKMSDSLGYILLRVNTDPPVDESIVIKEMDTVVKAYTDAIERVLGAKTGSIHLVETEALKEWIPGIRT